MRKYLNTAIQILSLIFIVLACTVKPPEGLSVEAWRCFGVFAAAVLLWVTQALPLSVTSLLVIGLLAFLKVMKADEVMASFGNKSVFFIIGAFILSASIMKTGLSKRFAAYLLKIFGRGRRSLFLPLGIMLTAGFLSWFMPEHAVVTFMFPIILEMAEALGLERGRSAFGKILFLSLAWGAIIGGVTTYLGGARNPLAIGMLSSRYDISIGFFQWMVPVLPVVGVLFTAAPIVLYLTQGRGKEKVDISAAERLLTETLRELGPMKRKEVTVLVLMVLTIAAWVIFGNRWGLASIAIISASCMFIFRIIEWDDVQKYVNWGVIIMYGGAIVLGQALNETEGIHWLTMKIMNCYSFTPFQILAVVAFFAILLTEGISNVAVVAMILPLAYGLADATGLNPVAVTYAVAIPSGLAFSLPIGTPPNAICYSSGYYKVSESFRSGFFMNMISYGVFVFMMYFYWPLIGLNY